jgi:hypothetical protein
MDKLGDGPPSSARFPGWLSIEIKLLLCPWVFVYLFRTARYGSKCWVKILLFFLVEFLKRDAITLSRNTHRLKG